MSPQWKFRTICLNLLLVVTISQQETMNETWMSKDSFDILIPTESWQMEEFFNQSKLVEILRSLDVLHIQLNHIAEATTNIIVKYLLRQTHCPIQVDSGEPHDENKTRPLTELASTARHYAVSMDATPISMEKNLRHYSSRGGTMICIFTLEEHEAFNVVGLETLKRNILERAEYFWRTDGIHRIYYYALTNSNHLLQPKVIGFFYNPFIVRSEQEPVYGALTQINDHDAEHNFKRLFKNMQGYPLRTYIFNSVYSAVEVNKDLNKRYVSKIYGADAQVALLLAERLNFTMQLQLPDREYFGARLENGSFNGALGRLIRYETDLTFTGFFVKDYHTRAVSFSAAIYMDELCCYVQKAHRIPQSILPLFAVNIDVWSSFLAVGVMCSFVWLLLRLLNLNLILSIYDNEARKKCGIADWSLLRQWSRIYIDTWVVWVRVNIIRYPPFMSERLFVLSLCIVSVIFGAVFESSLATVYIRPLYYRDIQTMAELEAANYQIYIKHAAMKDDLFIGHSSPVYERLDGRIVLVNELNERLIEKMSRIGGFAAVTRASSLVLDDIYYLITRRIHLITECPKNYHIAFVLPLAAPYEEAINSELLLFLQAGLIDQWIAAMKHRARARSAGSVSEAMPGEAWKVLTLADLQLAFYTLGLGSTIATMGFIVEQRHAIIFYRRRSRLFC